MTDIGELVIHIQASAQGLEAALEGASAMVQKFAQEAEGAMDKPLAPQVHTGGLQEALTQMTGLGDTARAVSAAALGSQRQALDALKKLTGQYRDNAKAGQDNLKTQELLGKAAKAAGAELKYEKGRLGELDRSLDAAGQGMQAYAALTQAGIRGVVAALEAEKLAHLAASGQTLDVNAGPAIAAINGAIQVLQFFLSLLGQAGLGTGAAPVSSGGGGGGGGGKSRRERAAEEARREAERVRQEAIRQDYDLLEHKRHLSQLTLEAELEMLEKIRAKHRLNAEEIMEWERKVYDVKQELRQRDAGSIDQAGDALLDALSARYEAMQEAEIGRLDASRKAWEDWRDGSVGAIRDQISALEELADTEDREKKDQEELRKIAKLRQDIEFEQDEYSRRKLQQQLDQALSTREDRLRKLELQDQKTALQKQIEAIEEQADAQIKALDGEQQAIEKAYAQRMKTAALRAEAEKLLMTGTQQEIIGLMGEFAPDYNALGKTLGEKLLEGFQAKVGGVADWFQKLNDSLYAIQEAAAQEAIRAADAFQAGYQARQSSASNTPPVVTVEQTVNINQPVETPSQAAKRLAEVNEALAEEILGRL